MTARNPLVRVAGKIVELPAGDVVGGAPAGTNGTNGDDGQNGGAITIAYTFSTTTTDADPGSGRLRLNNATQSSATQIYADLLDSGATDWTAVLDTFDASTNTNKADIRLVHATDATKWLTFTLTARTTATGYRKLTVTNTGSSGSSPFINSDPILLCWSRAGDKGTDGSNGTMAVIATVTTSSSQSSVDFSSIPNSYKVLKVFWQARDTASGTSFSNVRLKVNNDGTSGNYTATARMGSANGASFATTTAASAKGLVAGIMPNDGNTAGLIGVGEVTIVNYAGTTFHKRVFSVCSEEEATDGQLIVTLGARWASTSAINQITFLTDGTAFKDGSVFTLYGL